MSYLLDANTFIEAKNRYYGMEICPGYWEWLIDKNKSHALSSIDMIRNELEKGNDDLAVWAKNNKVLFQSCHDIPTQKAYAKVARYAATLPNLKPGALNEFLAVADSWLIAKALATSSIIVTHEQHNPDAKKKILIPNICSHFNVKWMDTFELLTELEAKFVQQKP